MSNHKDITGKTRLNLIPPRSQEAIAKIREFGAAKYTDEWGWREVVPADQLIEAAKRHLLAYDKGEILDKESGMPHLWHALTSLSMAVEIMEMEE